MRWKGVKLIVGICVIACSSLGGKADTPTKSLMYPVDMQARYLEGSKITFRLQGAGLAGDAAKQAIAVLNFYGTEKQTTNGLKQQENVVRNLITETKLPGVLIYVQEQTSLTEVAVTTLVGGKPIIIGPGLDQISAWKSYHTANQKDSFLPRPRSGYKRDDDASFFLWASGGTLEYGILVPATVIINEARRDLSDNDTPGSVC